MTNKIFKYLVVSVVAVFLLCAVLVFTFTYRSYSKLALEDVKLSCEYVKAGMEEYGTDYLESIENVDGRVTYILSDGTVYFDSGKDASEIENHLDREEVAEAIKYGEGSAVRKSATIGRNTSYYAMRLSDGSVIRVASEHFSPFNILMGLLQPALVLLLGVTLCSFFIAFRLSRVITKPINSIDLEHPEHTEIYEELRPMTAKLAEQNQKISKQMREMSRRQSEFSSITENMAEGMLVLNSKATILSCNRSAVSILGSEVKRGVNVLTLHDFDSFRKQTVSALSGNSDSCDMRLGDKIFRFTATPVLNDGRTIGAVLLIVDVTEREGREELRREFTSNVSHELKTPLTSISGFAELIRDGFAEGEDARRFAASIHKEASRLITLVRDVIKISETESGVMSIDGELELSSICREVMERLSAVAESAGVTLEGEISPCTVIGNAQLLEEMVYNLVDNAIKYNNEGGWVKISTRVEGEAVILSVSDNGIGIPADQQDRVFERFYRVDKSRSKARGGTGLGLSIVKHAAAFHKAEISLESTVGVGTTVRVRIVLSEGNASKKQDDLT